MVESVAAMEPSPLLFPVSAQIPHKPATSGRANRPDHFVATAQPRETPASKR